MSKFPKYIRRDGHPNDPKDVHYIRCASKIQANAILFLWYRCAYADLSPSQIEILKFLGPSKRTGSAPCSSYAVARCNLPACADDQLLQSLVGLSLIDERESLHHPIETSYWILPAGEAWLERNKKAEERKEE